MLQPEHFEPLPPRAFYLGPDRQTKVAVPVYFERWPWCVIPFVSGSARDPILCPVSCNVIDKASGDPLFSCPLSSDAAIAFVHRVAGYRLREDDHSAQVCAFLRRAMADVLGREPYCRVCGPF